MFLLGLIIGLSLGTIFSVVILKWFNKAKDTAKEIVKDVETEAHKLTKK